SLAESVSRIRAACANSGAGLPARRITVNLSPAAVPKQGSGFDLAIAIAIAAAQGLVPKARLADVVWLGELGLDGSVRPTSGTLATTLAAKTLGFKRVVVSAASYAEAAMVDGIEVVGVAHLRELLQQEWPTANHLNESAESMNSTNSTAPNGAEAPDLSDIIGQPDAIRALEVAAAGGHHLLLVGPPGAGKTLLAQRLPGILPPLSSEQAIETLALRSLTYNSSALRMSYTAPFESPHHGVSQAALIGGGTGIPRPGLASLAHNGVLFLDEAPEFSSNVLDSLRQPLESGELVISRALGTARFPASFQLVMAANPCACGQSEASGKNCQCSHLQRQRYMNRLSGPLLDRIDIRFRVSRVKALQDSEGSRTSAEVRERVLGARALAATRLSSTPWTLNARVPGVYLRKHLRPSKEATRNLDHALSAGRISMRGYDRCLRLAWTLADLSGRASPTSDDVATASILRSSDAGI
ncbi:MAG: Mg chelatase-like protein, partial [Phenylobacterium zucineum]